MTPEYDPCQPEWRADPYPHYRELRDQAPVYWAPQTGAFCVSRYDDVMHVLRSPELFSSSAMFTFLMNQGREGRPPLSWPMLRFVVRFVLQTRLNPGDFATARNLIAFINKVDALADRRIDADAADIMIDAAEATILLIDTTKTRRGR